MKKNISLSYKLYFKFITGYTGNPNICRMNDENNINEQFNLKILSY